MCVRSRLKYVLGSANHDGKIWAFGHPAREMLPLKGFIVPGPGHVEVLIGPYKDVDVGFKDCSWDKIGSLVERVRCWDCSMDGDLALGSWVFGTFELIEPETFNVRVAKYEQTFDDVLAVFRGDHAREWLVEVWVADVSLIWAQRVKGRGQPCLSFLVVLFSWSCISILPGWKPGPRTDSHRLGYA